MSRRRAHLASTALQGSSTLRRNPQLGTCFLAPDACVLLVNRPSVRTVTGLASEVPVHVDAPAVCAGVSCMLCFAPAIQVHAHDSNTLWFPLTQSSCIHAPACGQCAAHKKPSSYACL